MHRARAGLLICLTLALLATPTGAAAQTTAQRTIQDCDGDNLLEYAPGEPHVLFGSPSSGEDCASQAARAGRDDDGHDAAVLLNFLQLTDFQMVDEESPGRVEFVDGSQRAPGAQPFSAAYRPQEALTTQVSEAMVRQVRGATSPVTGTKPSLTILTGDNADSQQFNETRWFIDILDGNRRIDPNSGIPTAQCGATPGTRYDGVRDSGVQGAPDDGYYEPDASGGSADDGDGYSPDRARNAQETGRDVTVRDFRGLLERANEPFDARGIGMPWYSAFGNHDALVQGNSPQAYAGPLGAPATETFDPVFHALVTGCIKVKQPSDAAMQQITELYEAIGETPSPEQVALVLERAQQVLVEGDGGVNVPPDPRRCYLAKDDNADGAGLAPGPCSTGSFIRQHFRTGGTPVGHGFAPANPAYCIKYAQQADACRQAAARVGEDPTLGRPDSAVLAHDGYYSFVPKRGFRFLVLDTITDECGTIFCSEGSVDDTQFEWLRGQITAAEAAGQKILVFSHHTLRTTRFPSTDPTEQPQHNGERVDRRGGQPQPPSPEQTLEELFCQHPSVLAHVAGHEHENYVERHSCAADTPPTPGASPVFWHISTAAHIDWPQQSRMIEIVRARGQLALVLTMLDHSGPPNPGTAPADRSVPRLASIARELSYNDYQGSRAARGTRRDRNVVLPLGDRAP